MHIDRSNDENLPPATRYIMELLSPPSPDVQVSLDDLVKRGTMTFDQVLAISKTLDDRGVKRPDVDLLLRAKYAEFCLDLDMTFDQIIFMLREHPREVDQEAFKKLISSVAIVAAPRASRLAERRKTVADAVLAIAATVGVPTAVDHMDARTVGSLS